MVPKAFNYKIQLDNKFWWLNLKYYKIIYKIHKKLYDSISYIAHGKQLIG